MIADTKSLFPVFSSRQSNSRPSPSPSPPPYGVVEAQEREEHQRMQQLQQRQQQSRVAGSYASIHAPAAGGASRAIYPAYPVQPPPSSSLQANNRTSYGARQGVGGDIWSSTAASGSNNVRPDGKVDLSALSGPPRAPPPHQYRQPASTSNAAGRPGFQPVPSSSVNPNASLGNHAGPSYQPR